MATKKAKSKRQDVVVTDLVVEEKRAAYDKAMQEVKEKIVGLEAAHRNASEAYLELLGQELEENRDKYVQHLQFVRQASVEVTIAYVKAARLYSAFVLTIEEWRKEKEKKNGEQSETEVPEA